MGKKKISKHPRPKAAPRFVMVENTEGKESGATAEAPGITFVFRNPMTFCFIRRTDRRVFAADMLDGESVLIDLIHHARHPDAKPEILDIDPKPEGVTFEFAYPVAFCFVHNDDRIFIPQVTRGTRMMIDLVKRVLDLDGERRMELARKGFLGS